MTLNEMLIIFLVARWGKKKGQFSNLVKIAWSGIIEFT